ncbi:hypothetical protein J3R82DRAFT_1517 [Butyriboletus roseoflavus]|nr:hypothetical protein J3R82DRAFT_1517 [Butyriboletus roseoflavus]
MHTGVLSHAQVRTHVIGHLTCVVDLSARAAPLLRVLKISIAVPKYLGRGIDTDRDDQAHADNNHVLFNGNTPILDLTNYGMPWCSFAPSRLTGLRVRNLAAPIQLTMAELKIVLGHMPDPIQLHLENALRSGPPSSPCQDSEKLHLRSLSRLRIRAPLSDIVSILCYVEISSTTEVRSGCHQKTRPGADDFVLLCSLSVARRIREHGHLHRPHSRNSHSKLGKADAIRSQRFGSDRDFYDFSLWMSMEDSSLDTPLVVDVHP